MPITELNCSLLAVVYLQNLYTVKTAVLFWHKIDHIWYYVTKKNREKQEDGTKFDSFVC